jgi:hypothetical protein
MTCDIKIGLTMLSISFVVCSPAFAGGAYDIVAPCMSQVSGDHSQAVQLRAAEAAVTPLPMKASPDLTEALEQHKRNDNTSYLDQQIMPGFRKSVVRGEIGGEPHNLLESVVTQPRYEAFDRAKIDRDAPCKNDSWVDRPIRAPLNWIEQNIRASNRECTLITQFVRATTGISPRDIAKYGLLGGERSELRRFADIVAGGQNSEVRKTLRFLDPGNTQGIFGGANSFFRKPFG